jgi:uncharacterized membrane protein YjfL (UPF0719 family)
MKKTLDSMKKIIALTTYMLIAVPAHANPLELTGNALGDGVLSTVIYSVIGIIMAFASVKVVDLMTPGDLKRDIAENNNIALALLTGFIILGISIIIAAAIV